jgi:Flp pilus assembly protein CpaB
MMRRSPRVVALWLAALALGLTAALMIADTMVSLHRQEQRYGAVHHVVVARRDLAVGVTVGPHDVDTRSIRGDTEADNAVSSPSDAVGKVVVSPVLRGGEVTTRHLAAKRRSGGDVVPDGLRSMRIVIEGGTRPTAGDHVDVFATFDPQVLGDGAEPTVTLAEAAEVVRVDDVASSDAHGNSTGVTLFVTPETAKRLAFAQSAGELALAIAPPESARVPSDP